MQLVAPGDQPQTERKPFYKVGNKRLKPSEVRETVGNAEPVPATQVQDGSRGLSQEEIRRLEQKQYRERSIRADESRIR
jgi:hypothetical protein